MFSSLSRAIGRSLAAYLSKSRPGYRRLDTVPVEEVARVLETGDILLVEGDTRISIAIKYLTQSSWSHAAVFVGKRGETPATKNLIEADLNEGVRYVSLEYFRNFNLRICRPVGLSDDEKQELVRFLRARLGYQYDLRNVVDLVRYLIQKPAVPTYYRRALLGLGSGEPTRAICSTLIAEAFQQLNYPILPVHHGEVGRQGEVPAFYQRHFTHFTPRDFDLSPYFNIVKPTITGGFDFHELVWKEPGEALADAENTEVPLINSEDA